MPKETKRRKSSASKVYTRKHYKSNDGMLTTVWGPSTWHMLHTMSFNYPSNPTCEDKKSYREMVLNLKNVLPCGKCRENLKKNFKKLPLKMIHMKSRASFSKYIYQLHEVVNKMLHKKSGLTYNDVRERYEHFRARCVLEEGKEKPIDANKKEDGCTEPIYGKKAKCILKIVPQEEKSDTFQMDKKCIKRRDGGDLVK